MRALRIVMAAAALLIVAPGSARAEAVPERWVSDWGEGVCKLVRARGEPLEPSFMFEIVPGSDSLELWLVNPDLHLGQNRRVGGVTVALDPGGEITANAFIQR
jgi:hypothetical protein